MIEEQIVATLAHLLEESWELPIRVVVCGANDAFMAFSYEAAAGPGLEARLIFQHRQDGTFAFPAHLFFYSGDNAARILLAGPQQTALIQ